ncbi:MAG: putative Ig domain-containing protein, partial [Gammaproteobacteria bacterium]|nr:putative Ig domain-containing protein [Gammaproteobacteria bacterium]
MLSRLRRARWVHGLQLLVFTCWVANPFPGALSYWTDTNGDGVKEEIANPPEGDPWWEQDADGDGLNNATEVMFGSDPYSIDSDMDGLADSVEFQYSADALANGQPLPYDPWNWDSNGNGFSDFDEFYQQIQGYTPVVNYASLISSGTPFFSYSDADGDGLKNFEDSDPLNNDHDYDGVPDALETNADNDGDGLSNDAENTLHGTDPNNVDSDGDGLTDYEELLVYHTNPLAAMTHPNQLDTDYYMVDLTDSDGDQIPDRIEQWYASQGHGMSASDPNDAHGDLDGDGHSNLQAYQNGWSFIAHLNQYDSDGDGILDVLEDAWNAAYPGILSSSHFDDAVQDYDGDGVMNFEEIALGLNPGSANSRNPAVHDLQEWAWRVLCAGTAPASVPLHGVSLYGDADPSWQVLEDNDQDGVPDGLMAFVNAMTVNPALVSLPQRAVEGDYDGDGMPDVWEHRYDLDLRDAAGAIGNPDGDSLDNLQEYQMGGNPLIADDPPPLEIFDPIVPWVPEATGLEILAATLPDGVAGQTYHVMFEAVNGAAPYQFGFNGGTLPYGLNITSDGSLYGNILDTATGIFTFGVWVSDANGDSATRDFSIQVNPDNPPFNLYSEVPDGKVGVEYTATFSASGGMGPYQYEASYQGGFGLPEGLFLDGFTGIISGTPVSAGTYTFSVQVHDYGNTSTAGGNSVTGTFSVTFTELEIVTEELPAGGLAGSLYNAVITARNGTAPYLFSTVEREGDSGLPAGYVLLENGALTFIGGLTEPPPGGTYTFTVQVTDDMGFAAEKQLQLILESPPDPPPPPSLTITTLSLPDGVVGAYYEAVVSAENGSGLFQFSGEGPGLTVSMDGIISGILPDTPGSYTVSVSVHDYSEPPASAFAALTLVVKPLPPPPLEIQGEYYAFGGTGGYHWGLVWDENESGLVPAASLSSFEGPYTELTWTSSDGPGSHLETFTGHVILTDTGNTAVIKPVTLTLSVGGDEEGDEEEQEYKPDENDTPLEPGTPTEEPDEFHEVSTTDGAGSRYRKIGLNGLPMPDAKPQVKDESGEVPEETYIDAYSAELRHSVSDVYASADSSLLPLLVRRDCTDDIFHESAAGFAADFLQRIDRPFGAGWTTNLCATVKVEDNGMRATVTDEQGASHSFIRVKTAFGSSYWRSSTSATGDVKS